jgi:hypothetical protein
MAIVVWKSLRKSRLVSHLFLKAGLFYLVLASIGPFATGPMIAMGMKGSVLYFDAIYFYLHFMYNGWFTFAVLALLYRKLEDHRNTKQDYRAFLLLNLSVIPSFFLSTLWSHPPLILNIIGGLSALLQIYAAYLVIKAYLQTKFSPSFSTSLTTIALSAFAFKNFLQFLSAFPYFADLAYHNRNFVIAYLHLVLLGFISLYIMSIIFSLLAMKKTQIKKAILTFIIGLTTTELLLVFQASGLLTHLPPTTYYQLLWLLSTLFPISIFLLYQYHNQKPFKKIKKNEKLLITDY